MNNVLVVPPIVQQQWKGRCQWNAGVSSPEEQAMGLSAAPQEGRSGSCRLLEQAAEI